MVLAGVALLGEQAVEPAGALHAAAPAPVSSGSGDADSDGLPDVLEVRLGLNPDKDDTDGDGVCDAEELARHSLGTDPTSLPSSAPTTVNLVAYQDGGPVHLVTVVYAADGNLATKTLGMGARIGNKVRQAPVAYFTQNATFTNLPGKSIGSAILVIDAPLDPLLLVRFESLSFYSSIAVNGKKVGAGVVNLALKRGVEVEYIPSGILAVGVGRATLSNSFYGPVDTNAVLEWVPGEICGQTTAVAATMGPVIVEEVIEAACEPGWDSYCDPGCAASVGETIQSIDPAALIIG